MAEIQHSNIPDDLLHEVKHAISATANTFLRAKGDGTTEFVELDNSSFKDVVDLTPNATATADVTLTIGKQYVFILGKTDQTTGLVEYKNDLIDLRGGIIPTGANKLLSVGGNVQYLSGQLSSVDPAYTLTKISEIQ